MGTRVLKEDTKDSNDRTFSTDLLLRLIPNCRYPVEPLKAGVVSPQRSVPAHIQRPAYAQLSNAKAAQPRLSKQPAIHDEQVCLRLSALALALLCQAHLLAFRMYWVAPVGV